MAQEITTIIEAAAQFGVQRETIGDLVKQLGIEPKPVPRNGNAKGLDRADMALIRERLTPPGRKRRGKRVTASA